MNKIELFQPGIDWAQPRGLYHWGATGDLGEKTPYVYRTIVSTPHAVQGVAQYAEGVDGGENIVVTLHGRFGASVRVDAVEVASNGVPLYRLSGDFAIQKGAMYSPDFTQGFNLLHLTQALFRTYERFDIVGSPGNDRVQFESGAMNVDGREGVDTLDLSGLESDGSWTYENGTFEWDDGHIVARNVERLAFEDRTIAWDAEGSAGQAYRMYRAAFGRQPDAEGLGFQVGELDAGLPLRQLAGNFMASPEFQRTYGALDDRAFVHQLYLNVLNREADADGLAFHEGNLGSGMSRAEVLMGFSESPENQAAVVGTIQQGITLDL